MTVPKMKRLIERAEFEKRLADHSTNVLKSFRATLQHVAALEARIAALEAVNQPRVEQ